MVQPSNYDLIPMAQSHNFSSDFQNLGQLSVLHLVFVVVCMTHDFCTVDPFCRTTEFSPLSARSLKVPSGRQRVTHTVHAQPLRHMVVTAS